MTSSNQRVSSTLRSVIENGYAWPSAGIIGAAANLLDDVSLLLGRLAECFADDEQEFADIKLMRDRLDDVDSRERHVATDESARRHAVESDCLRRFAEWAAGAACDDEYAPRMVKHIAAIAKDALAGNSDIAGYPTGISSRVETSAPSCHTTMDGAWSEFLTNTASDRSTWEAFQYAWVARGELDPTWAQLEAQCQAIWRTNVTLVCQLSKGHAGAHGCGRHTWNGEVDTKASSPLEPSPEPCKHGHTNQGCRECFPLKATAPLKCKCGRDLVPYAGCPVCDVPAQNGKR